MFCNAEGHLLENEGWKKWQIGIYFTLIWTRTWNSGKVGRLCKEMKERFKKCFNEFCLCRILQALILVEECYLVFPWYIEYMFHMGVLNLLFSGSKERLEHLLAFVVPFQVPLAKIILQLEWNIWGVAEYALIKVYVKGLGNVDKSNFNIPEVWAM